MRGRLVVAALVLAAGSAAAQVPGVRRQVIRVDTAALRQRADSLRFARTRADTARILGDTTREDTASAGRGAGLPRRPTRTFQTPDSVIQALMRREGYHITRYGADSVQFLAEEREIRLSGQSLVEREGSILEADTVRYIEANCEIRAAGGPHLFDRTGVVIGRGMRYDACNHAGIIEKATTDFQEGGATWYLRGNLAVDNEENRLYAARSNITSCDLIEPHYHFAARRVKWVSRRILVSRPAILYVADVPVLWLPFIFQDLRRGRRSGLIPPQFGINDIVRNTPSYKRHVANLGYYWVMSDYSDAQVTVDWYAQRFVAVNGRLRYRWLDRFLAGGLGYQELRETSGSVSRRINWSHQQDFSLSSRLTANIDYASSSRVISRNAVDPILAVATIDSRLNFQRRFTWGTLSLGGSRTQSLDKPQVTMQFPVVAFAPQPISLGRSVTWSPSFNFTNSTLRNGGPAGLIYRGPEAAFRVDTLLADSRQTSFAISTPLRIGRWNWSNAFQVQDQWANTRQVVRIPDPADTTRQIVRTYTESFQTSVDWATGINLPVLFQGTWNLQPRIDIVNTTGGPYLIRNRFTGGEFVSQGKRLGYAASISPTFFGLFGGLGPIARVRHSISPSLSWSYTPAARIPEAFSRAISADGRATNLRSRARQTLTFGLSQNFEAKLRPPRREGAQDTAATGAEPAEGRKIKLLSVQSGGIAIDLEQAKLRGRTGWLTDTWTNTFSSDLLRGFSLSTSHDLFDGPVGVVGSRFGPFLTSVSMRFSLGSGTLRSVASLLGLAGARGAEEERADTAGARDSTGVPGLAITNAFQRGLATRYSALDRLGPQAGARTGFSASLSFDAQRQRPAPAAPGAAAARPTTTENRTVSGSLSFSPTAHWSVSWQTQYNFTLGKFGEHVVRLDRDLHDWRATFSFVQSPNGNFLFNFFIQLIDQPDIKFEYDQRNIR